MSILEPAGAAEACCAKGAEEPLDQTRGFVLLPEVSRYIGHLVHIQAIRC